MASGCILYSRSSGLRVNAKRDIVIQDSNGRSRRIFAGKPVPEAYLEAYKAAVKDDAPKKAKAETAPEVDKMETGPEVSKGESKTRKQS